MNIKEIKENIKSEVQNIATLDNLKIYINYLIQEEKETEVENYFNKAIKLASDLQLPREEGALLIELGVHYWNQLDYKSALNMFRLSCGIFKQSKNDYDLVVATHNVGETYTKIGDYNNAISFLKLSLDFLKKIEGHNVKDVDELCANINNSLGTSYRKCKSFALSMSAYFRALELQEKHNLTHNICHTNLNIGKMFVDIGNFDRALKYFNKSLEMSLISNDLTVQSQSHALIGKLYRKNGKYSQAILFYEKALNYLKKSAKKNIYHIIKVFYEMALSYQGLKDNEKLISTCKTGLKLLNQTDFNIFKAKFKYLYGKTLDNMQQYNEAEQLFISALENIATEDAANSLKYKILRALSAIYEKQDSFDNAYLTLVKSNAYIDLMIQEKQEKALSELEAKFESQQKVREEIMLKKANQEVGELKKKVENLTQLVEEYQDIDNFFGVIPKDKIIETIKLHQHFHSQNGTDLTTLKLKLVADQVVPQGLIDRILSDISKLVMFYTREHDEIGRWGADSLILILANIKAQAINTIIDKIKLPIYNDILNKENYAKFDVQFELFN